MSFKLLYYNDMDEVYLERLRARGIELIRGKSPTEDNICQDITDCDALLALKSPENGFNRRIIDCGKKLRLIARFGVGYETVDVDYATEKGIYVTNTAGANFNAVAEATILLMLECARNAQHTAQRFRSERNEYPFFNSERKERGFDLRGKTLGLIGCGNIGRAVAKKAKCGLGMRVIGYDPYLKSNTEHIERAETAEEVYSQSDMVSLHLPATPATIRSVGMKQFRMMKPGAFLINAARGNIIAEEELIEALQQGVIRGAGLDVYTYEPLRDISLPLFELDHVVLAPHNAASTVEAYTNIVNSVIDSIIEVVEGKIPTHRVNEPKCIDRDVQS